MAITIELSSSELDDDDLLAETRQLYLDLREEGLDASLTESEPVAGNKGAELVLIAVLGSTVLSAFVGVLTAYVQRAKAVTIKIQEDGKTIEITANNVQEAEYLLEKYRQVK